MDDWIACTPPPVALGGAKVFVIGQVAYFNLSAIPAGWNSTVWVYDTVLDQWTQKAPFTGPLRSGFVAFSIGGTGYIATGRIGGSNYLNDLWSYDPIVDVWTQRASITGSGRHGAFAFTINGIGYVGAGSSGIIGNGETFYTALNAYDPLTNTWTAKAATVGRNNAVGFSMGGFGYMGMGRPSSTMTNDLRRYDPVADAWSYVGVIGGLASGARSTGIAFAIGNTAYIGGGLMSSGGQQIKHNDLWACDGSTGIFTEKRTIGGNPRESHFAFAVNGKGYVGCGVNSGTEIGWFWEFDPTTGEWARKADAGISGSIRMVGTSAAGMGYTATGNNYSSSPGTQGMRAYDPTANAWTAKASLPGTARTGAVGFTLLGRSYVTTGVNAGSNYLADLWSYDPSSNTWTQRAPFPGAARADAVGFNIGNKGYVATGRAGTTNYNDLWEYDPISDGWTQKSSMPVIGRYRAVGFAVGAKGYIACGNNGANLNDLWEFDPVLDTWTQRSSLPAGVRVFAAAFSIGPHGYVVGGIGGQVLGDVWRYTPIDPAAQVLLNIRVFLGGPYINAQQGMSDALRTSGLIPLQEPYSSLGYPHALGGGETTTATALNLAGNNANVDWVLVELRHATDPSVVVASLSCLLQRDGDLVMADGTSPLLLNALAGQYYVAVRHRNHLGVMTASPLSLGSSPATIDFSNPVTPTFGSNSTVNVNGTMVLWSGDATFNSQVKYTGTGNDRDAVLLRIGGTVPTNTVSGYYTEDCNLDGLVMYTGAANDRDIILQTIGGAVPTNTRNAQLP